MFPDSRGIVHLGLGAFARAHCLLYTESAAEISGDGSWGVLGVTGRRADVADALRPQDGLYGVLFRSAESTTLRVVGSVLEVAGASEFDRVVAAIADPSTRVVTLTITEKAYNRSSAPIRILDAALRARFQAGGSPLAVLSCDNLIGNGSVLRQLMSEEVEPGPYAEWLGERVAFPSSMVDRIVPATTAADVVLAARISGRYDAGVVVAEPFGYWVVEDDFPAGRPRWEVAGAVMTKDVGPYESAKLRLLNGPHSLLAYAGAVRGYDTIARAIEDPELAARARALQVDAQLTLQAPDRFDLVQYASDVLVRFANPALRHTTRQVAMDGSQKLPIRIIGTARDALAAGAFPDGAAFAIGAWMAFLVREVRSGTDIDDPMAGALAALVGAELADLSVLTVALFGLAEIFGAPDSWPPHFITRVEHHARSLLGDTDVSAQSAGSAELC